MKITHLNSYYLTNALHQNLIRQLEKKGIEQEVYVPVSYSGEVIQNYKKIKFERTELKVAECFRNIDRYFWPLKMFKVWRNFNKEFDCKKLELIHAHSLIVNGLIAYLAKKKIGIPYVVTIRNTDVNIFMKRSSMFRYLGRKILQQADAVITLSPSYFKSQIHPLFSTEFIKQLDQKHYNVPNGASDYWFENKTLSAERNSNLKLIFVGRVSNNKNLKTVVEVCRELVKLGENIKLTVIGDGPLLEDFKQAKYSFDINFEGYITDKSILKRHYNDSHILIVPSFTESFGLVYVEAMTQSLPVIYTKDQGFDGFYDSGIFGFAVEAANVQDIVKKVQLIKQNYSLFSNNAYEYADRFKWDNSIDILRTIYSRILKKKE